MVIFHSYVSLPEGTDIHYVSGHQLYTKGNKLGYVSSMGFL